MQQHGSSLIRVYFKAFRQLLSMEEWMLMGRISGLEEVRGDGKTPAKPTRTVFVQLKTHIV